MNPRRRRFVHEYLKDLNGKQAAIRAGYAPASAEQEATRLLRIVQVRQAVDSAIAQRAVRVEAKTDDVVRELLRLATVDVGLAYNKHGALLPLQRMPEDVRRAITRIEVEEAKDDDGNVTGVVRKVWFSDKKGPLELLGKHLRMFDPKLPPKDQGSTGVQTSARWKPTEATKILKEIRKLKAGRDPDPNAEH